MLSEEHLQKEFKEKYGIEHWQEPWLFNAFIKNIFLEDMIKLEKMFKQLGGNND